MSSSGFKYRGMIMITRERTGKVNRGKNVADMKEGKRKVNKDNVSHILFYSQLWNCYK